METSSTGYTYEPRPRTGKSPPKHKWGEEYAGFKERGGGEVEGMCPKAMPQDTLKKLLDEGVKFFAPGEKHPGAIFNVHGGVPYKAYPTREGLSYHGFPCRKRDVPPTVLRALLAAAEKEKCRKEVEKWFKNHP